MPVEAGGRTLSCYEQVVVPAAYQTVQRRVLVKPEKRRLVETPAAYGYQNRRVLVRPERVSYRQTAPVYQTRQRRVLVRAASTGWEYRVRKGRKILCRVQHPAIFQNVTENVLVRPAGRVAIRYPAVYRSVKEKVLLRRASRHYVTEPAVYSLVTERVKVRDAQAVWRSVSARCR
ncbi:hypothetical protein [Roseibium sediminis]|uniref:hypothetical protein n=1 Tax=Roseibium sediminis TaxID=1775174 RepID=UPI00123CCA21|nr:hypothetical protein [Roseibium sediminis]